MTKKQNQEQQTDETLDKILQEVEDLKQAEKEEQSEISEKNTSDLEAKISQLEKEKNELEEKFLRANADMQNIRRRADEASIKARKEGAVDTLKPFLETLDTLSRALENIPENSQEDAFVQGIVSVEKNFSQALTQIGVEFFGENGDDFDANKHDSMMIAGDAEPGKIGQVFEKGIIFRGNILRHAKVSVGA